MQHGETSALAHALALTPEQARAAMGCAERVARAGGLPLDERTAELLAVLAPALGVGVDRSSVDPRVAFPEPRERRALVEALVIVACMPGEVPLPREREVLAIARELGVRSPFVELLPALRKRRTGAVADAPPGSYGRAVTEHFASRGLRFPGEKGGLPERMVHHDLMHVLNGYDTDPAGECELGAFYAACADGESFTFFVTVLATFHLGLAVSYVLSFLLGLHRDPELAARFRALAHAGDAFFLPDPPKHPPRVGRARHERALPAIVMPARGAFDPARAVAAFVRGRRVRVDVMGKWDYWELMPLPLEEARTRLGIAPS